MQKKKNFRERDKERKERYREMDEERGMKGVGCKESEGRGHAASVRQRAEGSPRA